MDDLTDREQMEMVKKWWNEYGKITLLAFAVVLSGSYGWNYFKGKRNQYSEYASMLYEQTQYSLVNEKFNDFETQADFLAKEYKRAPYAQLANLSLATRYVKQNNLDMAGKKFQEVMLNAHEPAIRQVARLRGARVLLAQKKMQDALGLLTKIDDPSYAPLIAEIRGDIYVALRDFDKARAAYKLALESISHEEMNRALLKMKYEQIANEYNEVA